MIYFHPDYAVEDKDAVVSEEYSILQNATLCNSLFHCQERKLERFLQKKGLRLLEEGMYMNDHHTITVMYASFRNMQDPDFEHHMPGWTEHGFTVRLVARADEPLAHKLKKFFGKYQHLTQMRATKKWTRLDL